MFIILWFETVVVKQLIYLFFTGIYKLRSEFSEEFSQDDPGRKGKDLGVAPSGHSFNPNYIELDPIISFCRSTHLSKIKISLDKRIFSKHCLYIFLETLQVPDSLNFEKDQNLSINRVSVREWEGSKFFKLFEKKIISYSKAKKLSVP